MKVSEGSAVFLDRDGIINAMIFNPATGEFESPHEPEDFHLLPAALPSLRDLQSAGFRLFLISNQPSFAKGKTTLEKIEAIHALLHKAVEAAGIVFTEYFYCYHHPDGKVEGYSGPCACRKPSPYFIQEAERKYNVDLARSWMIGDVDTDILCGSNAGCKTVLVRCPETAGKRKGGCRPDHEVDDLTEAVEVVLRESRASR